MSTLRTDLEFGDWIMNNKTEEHELYFVISVNTHGVWVYKFGETDPKELPIRMVNMSYIKVEPQTVKVLLGDKGIEVSSKQINVFSES